LGGFVLSAGGRTREIKPAAERRLVAALALAPSGRMDRVHLARTVWPETDDATGRNRLRTALVGLRKAVGDCDCVHSDRTDVWLDPETDCDVWAHRRSIRALDWDDSEAGLTAVLATADLPLLPDWPASWLAGPRQAWKDEVAASLVRASQAALDRQDYGLSRALAERATRQDPSDRAAWALALDSATRLGGGDVVRRSLAEARRTARGTEALPAPSEVARLAVDLDASLAAGRALDSMLATDPAAAAAFVASPAFRQEINRNATATLPILLRAAAACRGTPAEGSVTVTLMAARFMRNETDEVLRLAAMARRLPLTPEEEWRVENMMGYTHMLRRNWELAVSCSERAIELADRLEDATPKWTSRVQRASIRLFLGETAAAETAYRDAYETVKGQSDALVGFSRATIATNLGALLAMAGRWGEAGPWLEAAASEARLRAFADLIGYIEPISAYVAARLHQPKEAMASLGPSLGESLRRGRSRAFEIGLDFAAGALVAMGKPGMAKAVLAKGRAYRAASHHDRSPYERDFAERIRSEAGDAKPDRAVTAAKTPTEVVEAIDRAVRGS
jgi:DNA-binding SARP family transcriptional activator